MGEEDPRTPECKHKWINWHYNYTAKMADADRRDARGEKQIQCPHCKRWIWETHYNRGALK